MNSINTSREILHEAEYTLAEHPGHRHKTCLCQHREFIKSYFLSNITKLTHWTDIYDRADSELKNRVKRNKISEFMRSRFNQWSRQFPEFAKKHVLLWPKEEFQKLLSFVGIQKSDHDQVILSQRRRNWWVLRNARNAEKPIQDVPSATPASSPVIQVAAKPSMMPENASISATHPGHKERDCFCRYRTIFKKYFELNCEKKTTWTKIYDQADNNVKRRFRRDKFFRVFERFYLNWGYAFEETRNLHYRDWPKSRLTTLLTFLGVSPDLLETVLKIQKQTKAKISAPCSESQSPVQKRDCPQTASEPSGIKRLRSEPNNIDFETLFNTSPLKKSFRSGFSPLNSPYHSLGTETAIPDMHIENDDEPSSQSKGPTARELFDDAFSFEDLMPLLDDTHSPL